jgi:hypothetical protein
MGFEVPAVETLPACPLLPPVDVLPPVEVAPPLPDAPAVVPLLSSSSPQDTLAKPAKNAKPNKREIE